MAELSMNEMTTYRWSFEEDAHHYAKAGFPAMGVWRQKLSDFGEDKAIELLAETGLAVSSLLWAGGFTGSDGRSYKESVRDAQEAIRSAARLKAGCLVVYSGARAGHTHNHARRLLKSALGELIPFASEFGVTLAIEPMDAGCAAEWTFLTTMDEALSLVAELENPSLKLVFDTYHFGQDADLVQRLPEMVSQIALVHVGDGKGRPTGEQNRCRLGEGDLPLRQILSALAGTGYNGYYEIELMGEEIEATDYQELLDHSRRAMEPFCGVVHKP